ncbi:T6SS immunity protein Tli4 family protein [Ralstonia solanacearum]|uniref:T6SS immunity protein Tli4 family protein n=1 Tax=Ralstonia solanacearum TaxID=305 RepID=UPI000A7C5B08|nr:T6SS immunity protein Tli4 family protein [Ralstonia solanacearum]
MQQLSGCLMAIALMTFGCSSHAGETVLKEVEVTNRLGDRVKIPNPSQEDRLEATAPGYATPTGGRLECLGRLMFDVPNSTNFEWAVPSGTSKYGAYERLSQYFDNGTGRGKIEIETPQLRTVFAVYGPITPALLDAFLNYRAHMNEATLRGRLDSLKIQRERIEMFRQSPELLGPNGGERLAEELKKTEQDIADLKADRYQKVIDLGRPGSVAFRTNIKDSVAYMRGSIVLGKHLVAFESMLRGVGWYEQPSEAQWTSAEAALRKLIGQLQARDLYKIPKERGFCLPYAFLHDDGTFGNEISASFRLADSPAVIYKLNFAAVPAGTPSATTLLNATGRSMAGLLGNSPEGMKVTQRLGPRPVKIGALTSEQGGVVVQAQRSGKPPREGYHAYAGNAGWSGSQILPTIEVVMESASREAYPKLNADAPSYAEARPRFDALLKSIRLRPTTPPMPELVGIVSP